MSLCRNYRCFCADSSANIRGVQVLMETLTGIPMLPGAALKMHTMISLIQGSTTASEWHFSKSEGCSPFWWLFSDLEACRHERSLIKPTKTNIQTLLPAAGSGWSGYNHLAASYHCSHGHCLIPSRSGKLINLSSCSLLWWQIQCEAASVLSCTINENDCGRLVAVSYLKQTSELFL